MALSVAYLGARRDRQHACMLKGEPGAWQVHFYLHHISRSVQDRTTAGVLEVALVGRW